MRHKDLQSIESIKRHREPIRNVNIEHKENLSKINKVALWITEHVGSMGFFLLIFGWTITWLTWNMLAPLKLRFDPYPAFVFWLFISNMIQIFLMPLIMVGQNLQSKHSEIRSEEDYLVNKKAESEIEIIVKHLENQNELILQILKQVQQSENK